MNKPKEKIDPSGEAVSRQMQEAVEWVNEIVLSSSDEVGTGMATLAVSQAGAMAVQDAEAYMRNVMTVATAVYSAAFAEAIRNPASQKELLSVVADASSLVSLSITQFKESGVAAASVIEEVRSVDSSGRKEPAKGRRGKQG
ncbi:MAG: hypothetical protein AAF441_01115 [Pseudomonadota bacterium]